MGRFEVVEIIFFCMGALVLALVLAKERVAALLKTADIDVCTWEETVLA